MIDGKLNATSLLQFKTKVDAAADYLLSGWSTLQSMTCHLLSYLSPFCFKNNPVQPFKKIKYSNGAYITSWLQFALLSISLSLTPIRDSLKYYRWYWGYLSLIEVENKGVVAAVKDSKPNSLKIKYTQFVMFIPRFVPFQNKQWRQNVCFSQKAIVSRTKLSSVHPVPH